MSERIGYFISDEDFETLRRMAGSEWEAPSLYELAASVEKSPVWLTPSGEITTVRPLTIAERVEYEFAIKALLESRKGGDHPEG